MDHDHGHEHHYRTDDHHRHAHDHTLPRSARALTLALGVTGAFMLVEAAGGWYAHSLALLADARRTYGYQRYQVLAAFVNGLLLLVISGAILFEAASRLLAPEPVAGGVMLGIAALGLLVNVTSTFRASKQSSSPRCPDSPGCITSTRGRSRQSNR